MTNMTAAELVGSLSGSARSAVLAQLRQQGAPLETPKPKRSKYGAEPVVVDGIRFPSKREARRYGDLLRLRAAGVVLWFARQATFDLPGGVAYRCDFVVAWKDGRVTVEDAKGMATTEYKLKRRQMKNVLGIEVVEV